MYYITHKKSKNSNRGILGESPVDNIILIIRTIKLPCNRNITGLTI